MCPDIVSLLPQNSLPVQRPVNTVWSVHCNPNRMTILLAECQLLMRMTRYSLHV